MVASSGLFRPSPISGTAGVGSVLLKTGSHDPFNMSLTFTEPFKF